MTRSSGNPEGGATTPFGVCSPGNCPFHPDAGNWGMSPEVWEDMRQIHAEHANASVSEPEPPTAEWAKDAVEYIYLLQDALNRAVGFLHVYGWREDEAVIQRGRELRAALGIKGSGE